MNEQAGNRDDIRALRKELNKAERRARDMESELAAVLDHCHAWELWFDQDGVLRFSSQACKMITGHECDHFTAGLSRIGDMIIPDDYRNWNRFLAALTKPGAQAECSFRITRPDKEERWLALKGFHLANEKGKGQGIRLSIVDVSDQRQLQNHLSKLSFHDPLTGLYNRTSFLVRLKMVLDRSRDVDHGYFAVIYLDIDRLRKINDSLGHALGDALLIRFAERLTEAAGEDKTVARVSGDEFVLLMPAAPAPREVIRFVKKLRDTLNEPFVLNSHELHISSSMGIVLSPVDYELPEDLVRNASIAMRRAKDHGRNSFKVFNSRLLEESSRLTEMELDFGRGLAGGEFFIEYQPIISLRTHTITGFEALVRWNHVSRGVVSPTEFIPLAEETEFILPLGRWVMWESCSVMASWRKHYPHADKFTISVNVSALQIAQPDFVDMVKNVLEHTTLPPTSLKLEITESVIMKDPDMTIQRLKLLRDIGVKLSIDDFGTGYSSLAYLQRFPVDTLKVDQSFIRDMESSSQKHEVVEAVIKLAHTFNMDVVAEGVEENTQRELLDRLACESAQGFLFSRPMPATSIITMFDSEHKLPGK